MIVSKYWSQKIEPNKKKRRLDPEARYQIFIGTARSREE
jgi:hypothetical protein